ncbi:probable chitinase 2 [Nasonia vitripennis]|uniref:chitinase n=1 Tax=Nasonia vitripennis TaxID=7425 RepID=A0A7M7H7E8_NASVI|nr:probable chitinase 2 [Nasonia vitripennis]XP_032454795.1 probable chitinase 2 [Nasonia vitripennis]
MRAIAIVLAALLAMATASSDKKVVCYFGSWAVYRPGNGQIDISDIDPTLCTHLIYSFVGLGEDGSVNNLDAWNDLPSGKDSFGRFNALRQNSPDTKTMVAIGGWKEGSAKYSRVAANPNLRKRFVENVVAFVKKYNFDGFDVDWEYPAQRDGSPADKQNYVQLLKELRQRFDQEGLILSAAVGAAEGSASQSYDIAGISKHLDFINLMAYDLHGSWDHKTGINAPTYGSDTLNIQAVINYWLQQGAPSEKLVLGVPFYGRGFTLANSHMNGIGAPTNGPSRAGPYTQEPGMLGYNEICEKFLNENWHVEYDQEQQVPYAVSENQWVGYDDERSLTEKAGLVNKLNLGGMMAWSIETDDFKGVCGEKFPLLKTINYALRNGVVSSPKQALKQQQEPQEPTYQEPEQPSYQEPSYQEPSYQEPSYQEPSYQEPRYQEPEQPAQQPNPTGVCKTEGYARDPQQCNVFYYCQAFNGEFITSQFVCPGQLVFDLKTNVCNYKKFVSCF